MKNEIPSNFSDAGVFAERFAPATSQPRETFELSASRILHDFHRMVAKITGYSESELKSLTLNERLLDLSKELKDACESSAEQANRLLRFFLTQSSKKKIEGHEAKAQPNAISAKLSSPTAPFPPGDGTILLVEDEAMVRTVARRILLGCGYTVLEAGGGDEAIRIVESHPRLIQLLATDVVMPGMRCASMAERLLALRPATKVLYISGYGDDVVQRNGIRCDPAHFLRKPYTPQMLARKVGDVLADAV